MRKWFKRIGITLLLLIILIFFCAGYAYFIEPKRFIVVEETIAVPNWSPNLNGFRVVAISDIHGGSNYVTEERLREVVENANAQNADLIVLLGDYVSEARWERGALQRPEGTDRTELNMPVATIADNLSGFKAKYGVYAVIGNHDWYHNGNKVHAELERAGITVLENETVEIQVGGEKVSIWGIEDYWKKRRVPVDAYNALAEKQNIIAITHNPDSLLSAPNGISVMFAGHSHGGQINLPLYGPFSLVNDKRFMDGLAVVDGKHAYITSGVGTSVIPFRFRVPPEIAVITLNAETR